LLQSPLTRLRKALGFKGWGWFPIIHPNNIKHLAQPIRLGFLLSGVAFFRSEAAPEPFAQNIQKS